MILSGPTAAEARAIYVRAKAVMVIAASASIDLRYRRKLPEHPVAERARLQGRMTSPGRIAAVASIAELAKERTAAETRTVLQARKRRDLVVSQTYAKLNATIAGRRVIRNYLYPGPFFECGLMPSLDILRSFLKGDARAEMVLAVAESTHVGLDAFCAFIDRVYEVK